MRKKNHIVTETSLLTVAEKIKDLNLKELLAKLPPKKNRNNFTATQIAIVLKIFEITQNQSETARLTKISGKSIHTWVNRYGAAVFNVKSKGFVKPNGVSTEVMMFEADKLETAIAKSQEDYLLNAAKVMNEGVEKLSELFKKANTLKDIYPVSEGMRAIVEAYKVQKGLQEAGEKTGAGFFMQVHNMMIQNQYGKKD